VVTGTHTRFRLNLWVLSTSSAPCRVGILKPSKSSKSAIQENPTPQYTYFLRNPHIFTRRSPRQIDHERLIYLLEKRFKDRRLLELLRDILGSFRAELGIGVPIGSLTSQHFANFYLGWFDRFVKEQLRLQGYVRYMDDMLFWHDDQAALKAIGLGCREFVSRELKLEMKPSRIVPMRHGVGFLGCRIFPTHAELNGRSKRCWTRRVRYLERAHRLGQISDSELQQRLTALTAFVRGADVKSWRFRNNVLQRSAVNDP